ncbi:MAG: prepilin-type N-terminal cleavage/methylation domain-containing protein [Candidatus Microsaccharimonas sp.]
MKTRPKRRNRDRASAFTLVELLITVTVIALLATMVAIGLHHYTERGDDGVRESNVLVLSEALEKYYTKHGEYLSCEQMTADPGSITATTLVGIDQAVFRSPSAAEGVVNSVRCSDTGEADIFIYEVTPDRLSWTITYVLESEEGVKVAYSRQPVIAVTAEEPVIPDPEPEPEPEPDPEPEPEPTAPDPANPAVPGKSFDMSQLKIYCQSPSNAPSGYNVVIGSAISDAHGTEGNDYIYRGSGNKEIYAYGGDDIICASQGNGDIFAGEGDNAVVFSQGNPTIEGGSGVDFILNSDGNGNIYGFGGDDIIYIENGSPDVDGGPGNDIFYTRNGSPEIVGGSGTDKATKYPTSNADFTSIEEIIYL